MLADLQRLLESALASETPLRTLREGKGTLPPDARALVDRIDPDGFVLTSLLVRKLRFERATTGDLALAKAFEKDPARFTELFHAYCRAVSPRSFFPEEEAEAFLTWCQKQGVRPSNEQ